MNTQREEKEKKRKKEEKEEEKEEKKEEKKKKKEKKKLDKEKSLLTLPAIIIMLVSIILYILVYIVEKQDQEHIILHNFLLNAANVLMAVSIGSLVIEFYGFIDYMKNRIREVLLGDDYIKVLSDDKKKELKMKLDKHLYYPNATIRKDDLFYFVQEEITPLLQDYFYKEYIISIDLEFEEKYIKKKITKKMVLQNLDKQKEIILDDIIKLNLKKIPELPDEEQFKVLTFKLDNQTYSYTTDRDENNEDPYSLYDHVITVKHNNICFKENATLLVEYETRSLKEDCYFSTRLNKPCHHYCIHMNYDQNKVDMYAQGFGFMDHGNNDRKEMRTVLNGKVIRFTDWILPGDGTIFMFKEKKNHASCID